MHFLLSIKFLAFTFSLANAFTIPCINKPLYKKMDSLLKPVGIFNDPDRRTEEKWAREHNVPLEDVQKRYAATGILRCNNVELSANLVLVNDVIVTSAHAFWDPKTCAKVSDPKKCKFIVKVGEDEQQVQLEKVLSNGLKCPSSGSKPSDDWAVVRLAKKVKGVSPYAVDANQSVESEQRISSVAAINMDLFEKGKRLPDYTKTIGECYSHKVYVVGVEPGLFSSDCDGSQGQSGGAVLNDDLDKPPVLLGIHKSVSETDTQLADAVKRGEANQGEFVERDWANYHVALRGQFLNALLKAAQK